MTKPNKYVARTLRQWRRTVALTQKQIRDNKEERRILLDALVAGTPISLRLKATDKARHYFFNTAAPDRLLLGSSTKANTPKTQVSTRSIDHNSEMELGLILPKGYEQRKDHARAYTKLLDFFRTRSPSSAPVITDIFGDTLAHLTLSHAYQSPLETRSSGVTLIKDVQAAPRLQQFYAHAATLINYKRLYARHKEQALVSQDPTNNSMHYFVPDNNEDQELRQEELELVGGRV